MERNLVQALLLAMMAVMATACSDGSAGSSKSSLSYTDGFVDAMENALRSVEKQDPESSECDWSDREEPVPGDPNYIAFVRSQKLKYEVALLGHALYKSAQVEAEASPSDLEAQHKFRFMKYILGLSGYWEIAAARYPTKLLNDACAGVVTRWRKGIHVGAYPVEDFAPFTSAMGDVFLGVMTVEINRATEALDSEKAAQSAFLFGAFQEADAQFNIEESVSGVYYVTNLDPRGPITWSETQPPPLCSPGDGSCPLIVAPQSYIPQMVWLTLPLDILAYTGEETSANLAVEARGETYMKTFEAVKEPYVSLLSSTQRMLADANLVLIEESSTPLESLLEWLLVRSSQIPVSALEELLPNPPSVSPENKTMREAVLLAQKVNQDLLGFPNSGVIDPMVSIPSESGMGSDRTICDLYRSDDPSSFEGFDQDHFSCVPVQ